MTEKTYTPEQMQSAEKLADIISSVPQEKQNALIRTLEAVIIGVELADRLPSVSH